MSTHIIVNGLGLTYKRTVGLSMATLPDVCKTPSPGGPVPVPYPNFADQSTLDKGTTTVFAKGEMIAIKGSEYSVSTGDEAGTVGGVTSSTFKKETAWITYSFDVKMDGGNACRHTDKKFHNHKNTVDLAGNVDPAVPPFEAILSKCVNAARNNHDSKINPKPSTPEDWQTYCDRSKLDRGNAIEQEAVKCVQDEMAAQGRSNEVSYDQPYEGTPNGPCAVGSPGEVINGTARPDVVLHAPGNPNAVKGVYDFKAPCPPDRNMPQWGERGAFDQGENYVRVFGRAPKLVAPGYKIASYATSSMKVVARLLRVPL